MYDAVFALVVQGEKQLMLGDKVFTGLFLCSHNSNTVEKAIFRDVRIIRPAAAMKSS